MINNMKTTLVFYLLCVFILSNTVQAAITIYDEQNDFLNEPAFSSTTFYPIADSNIVQHFPDNTPGTLDYMTIVNEDGGGGTGWARDALIRFDTSTLPTDGFILSAKLRLYYYDWGDSNPAGRPLSCYRITSDWDEATVSWNTQPSYASYQTTTTRVPYRINTWIEWDVKSDVRHFIEGNYENFGWRIADETSWGGYDLPRTRTHSKEYGQNIPELRVIMLDTTTHNTQNPDVYATLKEQNLNLHNFPLLTFFVEHFPLVTEIVEHLIEYSRNTEFI
jgi:hypothetical protein